MAKIKSTERQLAVADGYAGLVKKIQTELSEVDFFIRRRTAEGYWKVGKFIHEHLLKNKQRANYGHFLLDSLSDDVDRHVSTLRRALKFYRIYPIRATWHELSWSQYRQLITIKDKNQRRQLEEQFRKKGLDVRKSQAYLNFRKLQLAIKEEPERPIAQLSFNRGVLFTYGLIESEDSDSGFLLDLGFRIRKNLKELENLKLVKGDCIQASNNNSFIKVSAQKEEIFTYKAKVEKIIDGDTLTALIDLGLGLFIQQKLRLRGIDCPEIDTQEGMKAKRFVETRLESCDFIVVKTYKDSTDKYDRYLADIFYPPLKSWRAGSPLNLRRAGLNDETDPNKVAQEGNYLNQELLNQRLAVVYNV